MSERVESEQDPWRGPREFAERLVRDLGFEDAADACRRNGWQGVLQLVLDQKARAEEPR
jgi:hypothetical protein